MTNTARVSGVASGGKTSRVSGLAQSFDYFDRWGGRWGRTWYRTWSGYKYNSIVVNPRVTTAAILDVTARVGVAPVVDNTIRVALFSNLLLEGDEQSGGDELLLEGDTQSNGDKLDLEGDEKTFGASHTKRVTSVP